jgi:predicted ATPase/class 3 adenylate cyclase
VTTAHGVPLPVGTVTFLRTDVEGSMRRIRRLGSAWDEVNAAHLAIVRGAIEARGGVVVRTEGDACFAAFAEARSAAAAAADIQRAIDGADLDPEGLLVRIGLHSGEAHLAGDDYGGFEVNRAARVAATGHGGQIVVSGATRALIEDELPSGTHLADLGRFVLKDVARPEQLSQLTVDGLRSSFPALRTGGSSMSMLPERLTSFVGRGDVHAGVVGLLGTARLITLTGPGGIGKTSLAVEVARAVEPRFADGAWFVPMADVTDPDELRAAVARRLGLTDGPMRPARDALLAFLAERSVVLVLDNLEHLLGAADAVAAMVRASPASRVLVTSRAPLHVIGEHEVPMQPLGEEAVRLFVDRARAVAPGWDPGPDAPVIREICELLDALPLGIELAAARMSLLSPEVIRDRLRASLPLPGSGPRDAPARQRTLEGAVGWSHDLLPPDQRQLLADLGVFDGGFDLEQATAVAGPGAHGSDRLDDLLALADQSLIQPKPAPTGRIRFRLLRTIRAFALGRLAASGHESDVRRRHADAYVSLLREALPHLNTSRHASWIDRVAPDQANLRAAARWTIDSGEGDLALQLTGVLWRFWHAFGALDEGRVLAERALAIPEAPTTGSTRAWAEAAAGNLAYWQADHPVARHHYERQIELAQAADDKVAETDGWFNLGHVLFIGNEAQAPEREFTDEVIGRYRELGDAWGEARAEWSFAVIAMTEGKVDEAYERFARDRERFDRLDDRQYHAMCSATLGWAAFMRGDAAAAIAYSVEALVETHAMRDLGTSTISLHIGVLMASMLGRTEDAARLSGAFESLCQRYGVRPPASLERFIGDLDPLGPARASLSPEAFAAAVEEGRHLSLDEAVALIVELGDAARAAPVAAPTPGGPG